MKRCGPTLIARQVMLGVVQTGDGLPIYHEICRIKSIQPDPFNSSACLGVKNIGKPCALIAHARFDEGGQVSVTRVRLVRHRQTKGAEMDMPNLMLYAPVLYSTIFNLYDVDMRANYQQITLTPLIMLPGPV